MRRLGAYILATVFVVGLCLAALAPRHQPRVVRPTPPAASNTPWLENAKMWNI